MDPVASDAASPCSTRSVVRVDGHPARQVHRPRRNRTDFDCAWLLSSTWILLVSSWSMASIGSRAVSTKRSGPSKVAAATMPSQLSPGAMRAAELLQLGPPQVAGISDGVERIAGRIRKLTVARSSSLRSPHDRLHIPKITSGNLAKGWNREFRSCEEDGKIVDRAAPPFQFHGPSLDQCLIRLEAVHEH